MKSSGKKQTLISVLFGITMFIVSGLAISWLRQYYDWSIVVPLMVIVASLLTLVGLFLDAWLKRRSVD